MNKNLIFILKPIKTKEKKALKCVTFLCVCVCVFTVLKRYIEQFIERNEMLKISLTNLLVLEKDRVKLRNKDKGQKHIYK